MLITPEYKEQQKQLHAVGNYGISSAKWVQLVMQLSTKSDLILDYGCGTGLLKRGLEDHRTVVEYDPCIDGKDAEPEPADMVVCTDVLEHIEPEYLDRVLDHIRSLTKRVAILAVATRPAVKTLPDGRNAHLIQESFSWWLPKLKERFVIHAVNMDEGEFSIVGSPNVENTHGSS